MGCPTHRSCNRFHAAAAPWLRDARAHWSKWVVPLQAFAVAWLRPLGVAFLICFVLGSVVALQVDGWRVHRPGVDIPGVKNTKLPDDVDLIAPNLHHVFASVPHLILNLPILTEFGNDLVGRKPGDWPELCRMDSDNDGVSNGDELGDPCCTWIPGKVPPYRVWNLTHPGYMASRLLPEMIQELSPKSCEKSNETEADRAAQLKAQYYMLHESDLKSDDALRWFKYPCSLVILTLLGNWVANRGLLRDLFGCGPAATEPQRELLRLERTAIYIAAYYWTDGIAGLTHLTFDFCPMWYPLIGSVAKGFQFHHHHPSAWVVVPIAVMVSHSLPLIGIISVALYVVPPRRHFRAFWALTMALCVITVLTHRWVHTPYEEGYWLFRKLQDVGLLMSHEHHLLHHDSLMRQFSNLSGVTDGFLDYISREWLSPTEYQHWLTIVVIYFTLPIMLGAERWSRGQAVAPMDSACDSPAQQRSQPGLKEV